MLHGLITILTGVAIALSVRGITALARRETTQANTVKSPRAFLIIGVIGLVFFMAFTLLAIRSGEWGGSLVFLAFCMVSGALILDGCNTRIRYDEEGFTARNIFGVSRRYTYDQITYIQGERKNVKVFLGKRRIRLDEAMLGKETFIEYARQRYRKQTGKPLTVQAANKHDIFRGNIENPGEIIFVHVLLLAVVIGLGAWILTDTYPKTPDDWEHAVITFSDWSEEEEYIRLTEEGFDGSYRLKLEPPEERAAFLASLPGSGSFDAAFTTGNENGSPVRYLKTLASEDGYVWLTEKTSLKNEWENWKGFVVLLSGLFVLVLLLFGVTVYVGRHPERVGEKWIYLFFKEGYVRYDFHKKDP